MKTILNEAAKFSIAFVLGLIYLWFFFSFAWSSGEMSTGEQIAGIVYCMVVIPLYVGIKRALRLS